MNFATILVVYFAVVATIVLILWGATCIARWRLFTKCGVPGWKALIPFYSGFTLYRISWRGRFFWIAIILFAAAIVSGNMAENNLIMAMIYDITFVVAAIFHVIQCFFLARKFRRGKVFAIGLCVLNIVFLFILAFDSSYFTGNEKEGLPARKPMC